MPLWGESEVAVDGCCCSAGTIHATLSLNKTGYVPGEPIEYTVEVNNRTDTTVTGLELGLRQVRN